MTPERISQQVHIVGGLLSNENHEVSRRQTLRLHFFGNEVGQNRCLDFGAREIPHRATVPGNGALHFGNGRNGPLIQRLGEDVLYTHQFGRRTIIIEQRDALRGEISLVLWLHASRAGFADLPDPRMSSLRSGRPWMCPALPNWKRYVSFPA